MDIEESDLSLLSLFVTNFGFAYNSVEFSDRVLRIEITASSGEGTSCSSLVALDENRKRKRENIKVENENPLEDENNLSILKVRELHVCSAILASKSQFFYKLFSNGMLESEQKHTTLKIDASEERGVMEILNFMYKNSLSVKTTRALLEVLMVADKFEVESCMKYCSRSLLKKPMTLDSALLLLKLPSPLLMAFSVKPLINAAKQFIASRYKDISTVPMWELMALPLVGIQTILASESVEVESEDLLYENVLKWAKSHYPVLEERQEILGSHLAPYIRFPYMTCDTLRKISTSDDFTPSMASMLVSEAALFKAEPLYKKRLLSHQQQQPDSINHWFVERPNPLRPLKEVEFDSPRPRCIVYLDLKLQECESMYPSGHISSRTFQLGGLTFFLSVQCCYMNLPGSIHSFGLFIETKEHGSASPTVDFHISMRRKPAEEFEVYLKQRSKFSEGQAKGCFAFPWDTFVTKQCPYFINDVLHLRADLSICP